MKLRHINPHNVRHLIPKWAIDPFLLAQEMDRLMGEYVDGRTPPRWDATLRFWFDAKFNGEGWMLRIAEPDGEDHVSCGRLILDHPDWSISVPLNDMLKGAPLAEHTHSLYVHAFDGEAPLSYVGITRQRWYDRLSQHERSAQAGSPYLFHKALRDKRGDKVAHLIIATSLAHETVMQLEEEFVEEFTLYPLGLNMIPGGFAGIRYLHTLGIKAQTARERDVAIESMVARESIEGRPNPLCAARWVSDQEYVNRVICGHGDRLTIDQVRKIRMFSASGKPVPRIAELIGDCVKRVTNVLTGKRYGRAA